MKIISQYSLLKCQITNLASNGWRENICQKSSSEICDKNVLENHLILNKICPSAFQLGFQLQKTIKRHAKVVDLYTTMNGILISWYYAIWSQNVIIPAVQYGKPRLGCTKNHQICCSIVSIHVKTTVVFVVFSTFETFAPALRPHIQMRGPFEYFMANITYQYQHCWPHKGGLPPQNIYHIIITYIQEIWQDNSCNQNIIISKIVGSIISLNYQLVSHFFSCVCIFWMHLSYLQG